MTRDGPWRWREGGVPAVADREFKSEGFFEYHLYALDGRTTIKESQIKQLTLLSASDFPVDKQFIYYGAASYHRTQYGVPISNQKVGVYLDIRNTKENRLGVPLPRGKVRVYKADASGSQQLIGEDWIDHTPKDERCGSRWARPSTWWASGCRRTGRRSAAISTRSSGDHPPQPQEGGGDRRGDRADARRLGGPARHASHEKLQAFTARWRIPVAKEGATPSATVPACASSRTASG